MNELIQTILDALQRTFHSPQLVTVLIAALPIVEARLAVPIGIGMNMSRLGAWFFAYLGSTVLAPLLLVVLIPFIRFLARTRLFRKLGSAIYDKFEKKSRKVAGVDDPPNPQPASGANNSAAGKTGSSEKVNAGANFDASSAAGKVDLNGKTNTGADSENASGAGKVDLNGKTNAGTNSENVSGMVEINRSSAAAGVNGSSLSGKVSANGKVVSNEKANAGGNSEVLSGSEKRGSGGNSEVVSGEKRTRKGLSRENKKMLGVFLFVAIPLPLTGVWTGCAVASIVGLKYWKSLVAVASGNLVASLIVLTLCVFFEPYVNYIILALAAIAVVVVIVLIVKVILHKPAPPDQSSGTDNG